MSTLRTVIAFLIFAAPCLAQDLLLEKPQPRPAGRVADLDRKLFWAEAGTMAAAWTVDTISTRDAFAANPAHHEVGMLLPGSRSTAEVMGAWAAVDVAAAVGAYEWKEHVKNRYLHPLWHVFMLGRIEGHASGAANNWSIQNGTEIALRPPVCSIPVAHAAAGHNVIRCAQ